MHRGDSRQLLDFYIAKECTLLLAAGVDEIVFQMRF